MAKKKTTARRVPRSTTPRTFGDGRPAQPETTTAEAEAPVAAGTNGFSSARTLQDVRRRAAARVESKPQLPLRAEYAYVLGDLQRLGILAAVMVAIMLVLGLIVH